MSTTTTPAHKAGTPPDETAPPAAGPLGRLGLWVTSHGKLVAIVWALLIVGLGVFAPQVEKNLSGAGWQADGSESVAARELARDSFGGNASSAIQVVVHSDEGPVTEGEGKAVIAEVRKAPQPGHRPSSSSTSGTTGPATRPRLARGSGR